MSDSGVDQNREKQIPRVARADMRGSRERGDEKASERRWADSAD